MKKPKDYDAFHQRGVDWCRENMAGNSTHGQAMRDYVDYENWRAARAQRFAAIRGWMTVATPSIVALAGGITWLCSRHP